MTATAIADPAPPDERGLLHGDDTEATTGTKVARGVLWLPKLVVEAIDLPIRGVVWTYDRFQLNELWYRYFYNEAQTFGIVPTIAYQTGLGITGGARLISKNTFGDHEYLTVAGTYGGTYHTRNEAWLDSGWRLDPVVLRLGGNFDRYDPLPFYGIGNRDTAPQPAMPVGASTTAFHTDYRYQELRAELSANWRVIDDLHLIGRGAITQFKSGAPSSGTSVDQVYTGVVGFDQTFSHLYGELELRWDRRRVAKVPWESTTYSCGYLVRGFVGRVHELDAGQDFTHYAVDVQDFLHLALGPRMLVLRFWGEGITANTSQVPFTELPYLGGDFLRGYDYARFRDRISAVASANYVWDLSRFADASVFVDAGRVYDSFDALTLDNMRVGYGVSVNLHNIDGSFLVGGTIASSIDGGIQLLATLSPLWNSTPRWR